MKFSKIEIIGFLSTWIILIGYLFIKINVINPVGSLYQTINLFGALGIIYVSIKRKSKQTAILNLVWFFIALFSIGRIFYEKKLFF